MKLLPLALAALLAPMSGCSESKQPTPAVEPTMTVVRCQALLRDGSQCPNQAADGCDRCVKHRVAKMVEDSREATGAAATKAWDKTKEVFDSARVGVVEMLGGKDAKESKANQDGK